MKNENIPLVECDIDSRVSCGCGARNLVKRNTLDFQLICCRYKNQFS